LRFGDFLKVTYEHAKILTIAKKYTGRER